ncbi:c-type cytochrome [Luteimonas sp. SJ-92]|uniref:C-type cytochrome n=1 Tax=Luteimonas salinisoli TaxID=2752307 RepID=A0A853JF98_9GAMM|nr:c-type cytochrome [Luteimonas salinisoli]NZA28033.1 c-type cytochrome [Luteimonas salinisoli]
MTRPLQLAACLLAALPFAAFAQQAPAQDQANTTATADATGPGSVDNGRMLTYTCQGCHGIANYKNAYPNFRVPKIGGQSQEYMINALNEYKRGTRRHPTMEAQAQSFSDQDIADIAAFLSSLNQ